MWLSCPNTDRFHADSGSQFTTMTLQPRTRQNLVPHLYNHVKVKWVVQKVKHNVASSKLLTQIISSTTLKKNTTNLFLNIKSIPHFLMKICIIREVKKISKTSTFQPQVLCPHCYRFQVHFLCASYFISRIFYFSRHTCLCRPLTTKKGCWGHPCSRNWVGGTRKLPRLNHFCRPLVESPISSSKIYSLGIIPS